MVSYHPANSVGPRNNGSGVMTFLEVKVQDSTSFCLNLSLLFISKTYGMKTASHVQSSGNGFTWHTHLVHPKIRNVYPKIFHIYSQKTNFSNGKLFHAHLKE